MFADVIPLLRMPRNTSTFTYRIPSHLEGMLVIGTVVRVPWRGKEVFAMVESLSETSTIRRTAEIIDRAEGTPSWNQTRLKVLRQHAQRQCASMATFAAALMPDVPKRGTKSVYTPISIPTREFRVKSADVEPLRAIAHNSSITHVRIGSQAERLFLYASWISQTNGQVLVLAPTLFDAQEIAQFLQVATKKRVTIWGGVLPKNAKWTLWSDIRDNVYDVVVSTRSGVFVPLESLKGIIIDQAEDQDHRSWEATPYYDARELAQSLANELQIPCRRTAIWPRTEDSLNQSWQVTPAQVPGTHTVIHEPNQGLFHATIESAIEDALTNNHGQVLIISSQVSAARAYLCLDCQYRWQCGVCGSPLQERSHELACDKCGHTENKPSACPRCSSTRMRGFALGLEALEHELPALFQVPVMRLDDASAPIKRGILLATPYAWRRWAHLKDAHIKMVVLFHPEKMLFSPDYRAQEWFAQHLTWHRVMIHDYLRAPLFIQTSLPEAHSLLDIVLRRDQKAFLDLELPARQRMHLPPYGESLSITTSAVDQDELRALGARLRQDFPDRVYGSVTDRKTGDTSWLIKLDPRQPHELDKLNDSIYSKTLLYRNPETPLL